MGTSVSREMAVQEGNQVQSAVVQVGMTEDLTAGEVTAHQAMIDGLNTDLTQEGTVQGTATRTRVQSKTKWADLYGFCKAVKEVALSKAPNSEGRWAMERADSAGGFSVTRARQLARQVQGALEGYPETFRAKGMSKAEILAALDEGLASDKTASRGRGALQDVQGEIREMVDKLDAENDRILTILENNFDKGSPERAVIDRARVRRRATTKKVTEQPEENK